MVGDSETKGNHTSREQKSVHPGWTLAASVDTLLELSSRAGKQARSTACCYFSKVPSSPVLQPSAPMARQISRKLAFCKPGAWTALGRRVTSQAVSEAAAAAVVEGTLYFRAALLNALRIPQFYPYRMSL